MSGSVQLGLHFDIQQMSIQIRQTGIIVTDEEAVRLKYLLAAAHKDFGYISKRIGEEEMRIEATKNVIQRTKIPLAKAKKSLKAHEANLAGFLEIQGRINDLFSTREAEKKEPGSPETVVSEVESSEVHRITAVLEDNNRDYQSRSASGLVIQIDYVRKEMEKTERQIRTLDKELEGLNFTLDQTMKMRQSLMTSLSSTKEVFAVTSKALIPISRMPVEVWTAIFKLTIHGEANYDWKQGISGHRRNTMIILTQVCLFWRDIIMNEPQLWTIVVAPSQSQLSRGETKLLNLALGKIRSPISLLSSADKLLRGRFSELGRVDEDKVLESKEFSINININTRINGYLSVHPAYLGAIAVTVEGKDPGFLGLFLNRINSFRRLKTLTVISMKQLQEINVSMTALQLTTLTLAFQVFGPRFPINLNSAITLVELHIRQELDQDLPRVQNLTLPHLQMLGITAPAINFLENLQSPLLERLIYYGPMDPCKVEVPSGDNSYSKYPRLTSIEFENWNKTSQRDGLTGAVGLFRNVLPKAPALRRVKFADSYVNGSGLLAAFGIGDNGDEAEVIGGVEEVTLSHCSGITRDECDRLKAVVKKLNIYV